MILFPSQGLKKPKDPRKNNSRILRDLSAQARVSENHWNL